MALTRGQKALLSAIRAKNLTRVRAILTANKVSPNFPQDGENTPLHEAVKAGSLPILKLLIAHGADVSRRMWDGTTAEDFARQTNARADIKKYLEDERLRYLGGAGKAAKKAGKGKAASDFNAAAAHPAKPTFSVQTLPDIFAPEKWIGHTQEMQDLWNEVPARLKKSFDFAAALSDARQQKLRDMPKGSSNVFSKKPKPPAAA